MQSELAIAVIFSLESNGVWGMAIEDSYEKLSLASLPKKVNEKRDAVEASERFS